MIPFLSLKPGVDAADVRAAIERVVTRGWFVLGPELEAFEQEFAAACGTSHAIGVGTGTDALALALRVLGIGPGDEVITSPLSAAYSALAIMMAGARPVFADIDPDRLTLDPRAAEAAVTTRTKAIMPIHLYGQPADMPALMQVAARHRLLVVEDCCQAHLATERGRPVVHSAPFRRTASTRRRTSARSATAARSRQRTPGWPRGCAGCATAARPIATITASSA